MLRPSGLLLTLFALLACGGANCQIITSPGQGPVPIPQPEPRQLDPAVEKKALDLVDSLSEQVLNLHASGNRIRAETQVADMLWTRDEKRARTLFTAAIAQLTNQIADLDYGDPEVYNEMQRINQMRQEVLLRLAPHDAELAISALERTRLPADNRSRYGGNWIPNNEANLEMMLANMIVATNADVALKLARVSLSRGVSSNLIMFLPALYKKDATSGQAFYEELVGRIKDDNVGRDAELSNNSWNLLTVFQPPEADEETFRDLLTLMLTFIVGNNPKDQPRLNLAQNMYYQVERIMPLVEKYAPTRAAELREWSRGIEKTIDPAAQMYQEMRRVSEKGTVDDMLALASKYPPGFQALLYQNAAWKAVNDGDPARAKEIAEKIADPVQRRQVVDQLDNIATKAAEGDNKVVEARRLAEKANTINRKLDILLRSAMSLAATDKKAALDLLSEAKSVLANSPQSAAELNGQLQLIQAYLRWDPDQAFGLLQPLVVRLNDLVAAAVVLDGVDYRYLRDGEWVMQGGNNLGNMINSLDRILAGLGRVDFDKARALEDQIGRPEMRVMMEIDLAQTTLSGKVNMNQMITGGGVIGSTIRVIN